MKTTRTRPGARGALLGALWVLSLTGGAGAQPSPGAAAARGVCEAAEVLVHNTSMRGSTVSQPDLFHASCAEGALSGERVYRLDLAEDARVTLRVAADYDVALYVRGVCHDAARELACIDDGDDSAHAALVLDLRAGSWWVVVDGYNDDNEGHFVLSTEVVVRRVGTEAQRSRRPSGG